MPLRSTGEWQVVNRTSNKQKGNSRIAPNLSSAGPRGEHERAASVLWGRPAGSGGVGKGSIGEESWIIAKLKFQNKRV